MKAHLADTIRPKHNEAEGKHKLKPYIPGTQKELCQAMRYTVKTLRRGGGLQIIIRVMTITRTIRSPMRSNSVQITFPIFET